MTQRHAAQRPSRLEQLAALFTASGWRRANQIWIGDQAIHDVEVANDVCDEEPLGTPIRLRLDAFEDYRSRKVVVGSFAAHGVRGQENQSNSSDATPLKVVNTPVPPNDFVKIASKNGGAKA